MKEAAEVVSDCFAEPVTWRPRVMETGAVALAPPRRRPLAPLKKNPFRLEKKMKCSFFCRYKFKCRKVLVTDMYIFMTVLPGAGIYPSYRLLVVNLVYLVEFKKL